MRIRLGTRGSPLALAQAVLTEATLHAADPGVIVERVVIKTTGDRQSETGAPEAGKGVFVKEIEEALLADRVDVAVHSAKDLPVDVPAGLVLAAVLPREDPRDAFCSRDGRTLDELPAGAKVGTGSPRRAAQLRRLYPHLAFVPIRGNVDTRLRKMREGEVDGAVLARAGLVRLGLATAITELLPAEVCLSAPGQGAVGLEARLADAATRAVLARVNDAPAFAAVTAERAFLRRLGGGCKTPIAALAVAEGDDLKLHGYIGEEEGARFVAGSAIAPAGDAEVLGVHLAERLLGEGAQELLDE